MIPKIKVLLRLCLLFLSIGSLSYLFAQAQNDLEIKDPFLSIDDKIRLVKDPLDISRFPYPIVLNGIIWTENVQVAIINNETVEKNQTWRDFKVEDIQKEKVILRVGNRRFEIPLESEKKDEQKKN